MTICLDSAIKRIKVYAFAVAGLNKRQLSLNAGLKPGTIRHIHDENWNPTLTTLKALESIIPPDWTFEETPAIFNPQKETAHDHQG